MQPPRSSIDDKTKSPAKYHLSARMHLSHLSGFGYVYAGILGNFCSELAPSIFYISFTVVQSPRKIFIYFRYQRNCLTPLWISDIPQSTYIRHTFPPIHTLRRARLVHLCSSTFECPCTTSTLCTRPRATIHSRRRSVN